MAANSYVVNKKLLEILVCPYDKITELDLIEFKTKTGDELKDYKYSDNSLRVSEKDKNNESTDKIPSLRMDDLSPISEKFNSESNALTIIEEGLLLCKNCQRYYPIIEEIPIILPDELRDKKKDMDLLLKWREAIPKDLLLSLKPWSISTR